MLEGLWGIFLFLPFALTRILGSTEAFLSVSTPPVPLFGTTSSNFVLLVSPAPNAGSWWGTGLSGGQCIG